MMTMKASKEAEIKVTVNIRPDKGADYQRALWHKFFTHLIAECQRELQASKPKEN